MISLRFNATWWQLANWAWWAYTYVAESISCYWLIALHIRYTVCSSRLVASCHHSCLIIQLVKHGGRTSGNIVLVHLALTLQALNTLWNLIDENYDMNKVRHVFTSQISSSHLSEPSCTLRHSSHYITPVLTHNTHYVPGYLQVCHSANINGCWGRVVVTVILLSCTSYIECQGETGPNKVSVFSPFEHHSGKNL